MKLQKAFFLVLGLALLVSLSSLISGGQNQKAQVISGNSVSNNDGSFVGSVTLTAPSGGTSLSPGGTTNMTCNVQVASPDVVVRRMSWSWFQNNGAQAGNLAFTNGAQLGGETISPGGEALYQSTSPSSYITASEASQSRQVTLPSITPGSNFKLQCVTFFRNITTGVDYGSITQSVLMNFTNAPAPVPGCMDPVATNYNANATVDDGSCTYPAPDTTVPSIPTGLTIGGAASSSLNLSWTASTDNVGVTKYEIYRNNGGSTAVNTTTPIAIVNAPTTTYTNIGLLSSKNYKYRVRAVDAAGNKSALSTTVTGTTLAVPTPNNITVGSATSSSLTVSWTPPTSGSIFDYVVYANNGGSTAVNTTTPIGTIPFGTNSFTHQNLTASTTYKYRVAARDVAANRSSLTTAKAGTTLATTITPASIPSGLSVTGTTQNSVSLSWSASTGATGQTVAYKVFRSLSSAGTYTQLGSTLVTGTSYTDSSLSASTTYYYKVQACYVAFPTNCSAQGNVAQGTTTAAPDTIAPSVPTNLSITDTTQSSISLSWSASTDTGGGSVAGYNVFRSTSSTGTYTQVGSLITGTSYTDTGLSQGTTYYYKVRACDNASTANCSAQSATPVSSTTLTIPSVPTGVTVGSPTTSSLTVSWNSVSGATSYKVYRMTSATSGTVDPMIPPFTVTAPNLTQTFTGLTAGTNYYYAVSAVNEIGESAKSSTATGTTSSPQITVASIDLIAATGGTVLQTLTGGETLNTGTQNAGLGSNISIKVTTNPSTAGSVVFNLQKPNGTTHTQTENTSPYSLFGDTGATTFSPWQDLQLGGYTLTVTPYAGTGGTGQVGVPQTIQFQLVNLDDFTPPSNPTNVTITYRSASQIKLAWTNSTSSDVSSYRVYRDSTSVGVVNHPTNTFTDTTVNATGTYSYKVTAIDASNNEAAMPGSGSSSPVLSTAYAINATVETTGNTSVKSSPESSGSAGTQSTGAIGTVTNGPVWIIGGIHYWYVDFTSGIDGWVNQTSIILSNPPDTTAPTANITAPTNNQVLAAGTTSVTLYVTTNEQATCRWGAADVAYGSMVNTFTGSGTTSHNYPLLGLTDGTSYTRYVRCQDTAGNAMATSASVTFSVASVSTPTDPVVNTTCPSSSEWPSSVTAASNTSGATNYYKMNKKAVILCAAISESSTPKTITLTWAPIEGRTPTSIQIWRKTETGSWSSVATPATSATSWTDTTAIVGTYYEYKVHMDTNYGPATGYIASGIKVPQEIYRGRLVLVIDNTKATGTNGSAPTGGTLATQVTQLINELTGDKWIVSPIYVSPTATPLSIRTSIKSIYDGDANTKAVYLFGDIPVASMGDLAPDGHTSRLISGDTIYGDMNETWTAGGGTFSWGGPVGEVTAPATDNKFAKTTVTPELQVGRVDFSNLATLGSENTLLTTYLTKARTFKTKGYTPQDKTYVRERVNPSQGGSSSRAGWNNAISVTGTGTSASPRVSSINGSDGNSMASVHLNMSSDADTAKSYLFAFGFDTRNDPSTQATNFILPSLSDWAGSNWGGVFNSVQASYMLEWNGANSLMRGVLSRGKALTMTWGYYKQWYFHQMGMGKNIGYSALRSINNTTSLYTPTGGWSDSDGYSGTNYTSSNAYMTLLGDPTLRAHYVGMPTGTFSVTNSGGMAAFSWGASSDSPLGYNIYEIQSNQIRKVNNSIISGTSFTSGDVYDANKKYMVTAVKVRAGNSGTYYNESLGLIGGGGGAQPPSDTTAPTTPGTPTTAGTTSTSVSLSWTASTDAVGVTGYKVFRSTTSTGTYTEVGTSATNSYTDGSLSPSTTYYYKVSAYDAAGNNSVQSGYVSGTTSAQQSGGQTVSGINGPVGPNLTTNTSACTNPSGGTIYYVDAVAGNDANNGTSVSTPWKSITQVNSALSGNVINAGKMVCFKRGQTHRGQLTVLRSGTTSAPIIFDAYGSGSAPVISGNMLVTNWTQHSGNIWKATVSTPTTVPKYLFINGDYQNISRHPNTGWYFTTGRTSSSISDTDNTWLASQAVGSLTGGEVVMRGSPWSYSIVKITGNSGTTMNGTAYTGGSINYGGGWTSLAWGYALRNKLSFLDTAGEWYFDAATNTVYLWAPNNANPNTLTVEMTSSAEGFYISTGQTDIIVRNFIIEGQTAYGVRISQAKRLTFENLEVRNGYAGIHQYALSGLPAADRNVFRNNYVHDLNVSGITIEGGDDHLIENNVIERISLVPERMYASGLTHIGIAHMGINGNMTSRRNIVRDTGYAGIAAAGGGLITENLVERSMQTLTDGSGITFDATNGLTISKNIIKDIGVGSGQNAGNGGSPNMITQPLIYVGYTAKDKGLYRGDSSSGGPVKNTHLDRNVVINVTDGVWLDHSLGFTGNSVTNNIIYDFNRAGIGFSDFSNYKAFPSCAPETNSPCFISPYDEVVTGNKLYGIASYQNPLFLLHSYSNGAGAIADWGTIDNNYYYNPFRTNKVHQVKNFNSQENQWTLAQWQANSAEDDNSTSSTYTLTNANDAADIFYNATASPITQSVNGCNANGTPLTGTQTIQPFTAIVVEYGNC